MTFENLISGALAGGIGYSSTLPLDFIKQHIQNGKPFYQLKNNIIQNPKILFRGGLTGLSSIVPQMSIKFQALNHLNYLPIPITGFIAGSLDGAFLGPVLAYQSMKQLNIQNKKIPYQSIIYKNFFPLMIPMALRNAVYTSVLFSTLPHTKKYLYGYNKTSFYQNFICASIVNIPATILCAPFDVLRANHINNLISNNKKLVETSKELIQQKIMFRGLNSLLINFALRFPLTIALQIYFLEKINFS